MFGKAIFAVGFGTGYVLGARAGRQRYESIMSSLRGVRENPQVQQAAATVQEQATDVASKASEAAKGKVADVRGGDDPQSARANPPVVTPLSGGTLTDTGTTTGTAPGTATSTGTAARTGTAPTAVPGGPVTPPRSTP